MTATVYSLATRSEVGAPLNSRGRRIGQHGNRPPAAIRERVIAALFIAADPVTLAVSDDVIREQSRWAGVSTRTTWNWWKAAKKAAAEKALTADDRSRLTGPAALPLAPASVLVRAVERCNGQAFAMTDAEVAFVAQHKSRRAAYVAAKADPDNRLGSLSERSFYRACAKVCASTWPAVGVGPGKGPKAVREKEAHPTRTSRGQVSRSMCMDQYQIKGLIRMPNGELRDGVQLLAVSWEASSLIASYQVLPTRGRVEDASRVVGEAVRGFSFDGFTVAGAGAFLRTDQAAEYVSAELSRRVLHVGIGLNPGESYSPGGNGNAESIFSLIDPDLALIPGTTQWVTDRSGTALFTGEIAWDDLLVIVDDIVRRYRFEATFTKGEWAGWTRFERHRELVETGTLTPRVARPRELAQLAVEDACNQYDPKKGLPFRNTHYLSREVAENALAQRLSVRTLVDETEVYVFDRHGTFLGTAVPREEQDDADKAGILADRAARSATCTRIVNAIAAAKVADGAKSVRDQASRHATGRAAAASRPSAAADADNTTSVGATRDQPDQDRDDPPAVPGADASSAAPSRPRASSRKTRSRDVRRQAALTKPVPVADLATALEQGLGAVLDPTSS